MVICDNQKTCKKISLDFPSDDKIILTPEYLSGKEYLKDNPSKCHTYYFYYDGQIWNMEDEEQVLTIQKLLCSKEDYLTAKIYNEFLMMITYIKGHSKWLHYPKEIQIEHTNRCNARCIMCGHYNADKRKCTDIEDDVFNELEKFLPFCKYVGLHGYGEPFITKKLKDYLEIYKIYKVRLYTNTNLSYITDEVLPYIAELFDELNVSFDSPFKETYESIRLNLSFDKVVDNIKKIRQQCPNVKLNLFAVVMRQNMEELEALIEFAYKMGFSQVSLSEMITLNENENNLDAPGCYPQVFSKNLTLASKKAKELGIEIYFPKEAIIACDIEKEKEERKLLNKLKNKKHTELETSTADNDKNLLFSREKLMEQDVRNGVHKCTGICDVFFGQLYCSLDGKLALCCVDGYHYSCNVKDINTIQEYWETTEVQFVRDAFNKGVLPKVCNNCNYIALNRLKQLQISDRKKYIDMINY